MRRNKRKYVGIAIVAMSIIISSAIQLTAKEAPVSNTIASQKKAAFQVLNTKCNVCHSKQNKKKIFSLENMNGFAPLINHQVFVLRRMPRGKKIKLSMQEYQTLKTWLLTQNLNLNK